MVILTLTIASIGTGIYFAWQPLEAESFALWIACIVIITYSVLAEKHDAIILNGTLMALYLAFMTSLDL